jgi:hypothetical protein
LQIIIKFFNRNAFCIFYLFDQEYYRAIRRSTRHNDSVIFAAFMLAAIKQATAEFKAKYNRGEIQSESNTNEDVNDDVNDDVKLTEIQIIYQ